MGHLPIPDHKITICISCIDQKTQSRPGPELIDKLKTAIDAADPAIAQNYAISGIACMAGCAHPCTIAYQAERKASYLFGDIEPDTDLADLVKFARQYAQLPDGWSSSRERPGKLQDAALARIPAAFASQPASQGVPAPQGHDQ